MLKQQYLKNFNAQVLLGCLLLLSSATSIVNAAVEFSIDADPAVARPGDLVTVSFTVGNTSNSTVQALSMRMRYPENLQRITRSTIVDASDLDDVVCPGRFYCDSGDLMNFTLPDLPAGTFINVNMLVRVDSRVADGESIEFGPEIRIDGNRDVETSTTVTVQAEPFYELSLRGSSQPITTDGELVYTLNYSNVSDSPSTDTVATVTLPSGVSYVSGSGEAVEAGGEVSWQIGDLSAGDSAKETIVARVNPGVVSDGQLLQARASIVGVDSGFREYNVVTSHSTQATSETVPDVSLEITPQTAKPGKLLQTLITVSNSSDSIMNDVQLKLRWPSYLNRMSLAYVSLGNKSNTAHCGRDRNYCDAGDVMTLNLSNIPAAGGVTVSIPAVIFSRIRPGTLVRFDVKAKATGVHASRKMETVSISTRPPYLLSLHESSNPTPIDGQVTYSVNYANAGVSTLSNSILSLTLPKGMVFKKTTNLGNHQNGTVTWNIGNLRTGYGGQRKVTATVATGALQNGNIATARASIVGEDDGAQPQSAWAVRDVRIGASRLPTINFDHEAQVYPGRDPSYFYTDVINSSNRLLPDLSVVMRYPETLNRLSTSLVETGSATNTVVCRSTSFCDPADLMEFSLSNLRPRETLRTEIPLQARTTTINLTPFQGEVRVGGVQVRTVSTTLFQLDKFSPAVDPPLTNKTVTIRPGGNISSSYGYGDGSETQVTKQLLVKFNSKRQHLAFRVRGFDIDRKQEVRVHFNGKLLGALSSTRNNRHNAGDIFWLPKPGIRTGRLNEVTVEHRAENDVWGVDRISLSTLKIGNRVRLRPGVVSKTSRGWQYGRTRHRDGLELAFARRNKNLKLYLNGYDIDRSDELTVFVNGKYVGRLSKGRSNRLTGKNSFTIRKSDQIAGTNSIMLLQKYSGEKWGVSNLLLR